MGTSTVILYKCTGEFRVEAWGLAWGPGRRVLHPGRLTARFCATVGQSEINSPKHETVSVTAKPDIFGTRASRWA